MELSSKTQYHFAFPPAVYENSYCSTSSPAFGVNVLDCGHSNRCIMVSHYCFNLHFRDGIWYGSSFHVLLCHLFIFFGEVSVKVFGPFFNWVVCFTLLNFRSSVYMLDNSPLSDLSFANIFSQSVAYLLVLLIFTVFHRAEVFNFNEVQLTNYFFHGLCLECCF